MKRSSLIKNYLYDHQGEILETLEALVNAESPSTVPQTQQEVFKILSHAWQKQGYKVRYFKGKESGGQLMAFPKKRLKHQSLQLLIGHGDTVWPLGTLRKMPFKQKNGKLYGPGIYDMKAGLVLMIYAIAALQYHDTFPSVMPLIFINSDEEIGSNDSKNNLIRLSKLAKRAYVFEPSLGLEGKLKTRRKGLSEYTIEVIGKASHAGLAPEQGASAILELSHLIQRLFSLNDPQKGITVNVGTINGGIRPNVVAPNSQAVVEVRTLTLKDAQQIDTIIRNLQPHTVGTRIIIKGGIDRPPMEKNPDNDLLWQQAQQAATELGFGLDEGTAGGASDGNFINHYTPTLDGMGAVGDGAHSPGEFVYMDNLPERAALLSSLLLLP